MKSLLNANGTKSLLTVISILGLCAILIWAVVILSKALWDGYHLISPSRVFLYVVIPGTLALACFIGIVKKGARGVILIISIAFVTALYAAEFVIHTFPASSNGTKAPIGESMTTLCGPNSWRHTGSNYLEPITLSINGRAGYLPIGGISKFEVPNYERSTDIHGFNNPPGQWQPGRVKFLAVGDSFTWGHDVPAGYGFVDLIRNRFGPTVNLGCAGNGPLIELASLVEYGPVLRPEVVLWFYYEGNDIGNLEYNRRTLLFKYVDEPGYRLGLIDYQDEIDQHLKNIATQKSNVKKWSETDVNTRKFNWDLFVRLYLLRFSLGVSQVFYPRVIDDFARIMDRAKESVTSWGGRLIFVYLPMEGRYVTKLGEADAKAYGSRIMELVREQQIEVIDVAKVFAKTPDPRDLYQGHFNATGNQVVADAIEWFFRNGTRTDTGP